MATNAANREIKRLRYMRQVMVAISPGGSSGTGRTAGISLGIMD